MYLIHISADLINLYLIVQKQYDNYITIFFYLFLLTIISNREIIPKYIIYISSIYLFITFYFFTQFLLESSEPFNFIHVLMIINSFTRFNLIYYGCW